jgi:ABC-type oligopeptide transport system ATPase subunit
MMTLDQVSKQYKSSARPALDNISVKIDKGEFVFLIGPSGSGKSTFMRLLLAEEHPSSGDIRVSKFHVNKLAGRHIPGLRQVIGCVFQDFRLIVSAGTAAVWPAVGGIDEVPGECVVDFGHEWFPFGGCASSSPSAPPPATKSPTPCTFPTTAATSARTSRRAASSHGPTSAPPAPRSGSWLGAFLGSSIEAPDAIGSLQQVGNSVFPGFGTFAVLVCIPALVSIMAINFYGAMLTGASAVDGFRPVKATVRSRVVGIAVVAVIAYIVALLIPDNYLTSFNNFVLLMLYFLIPWTAVNLVDFYFARRGHYAITEIFKPNGIYGRWSWHGLVAYVVGFAAMIPFLSTTFYVGPAAEAMNGADISFIVGLVVSGGLYLILCRGLDLDAEQAAIVASDRELEQRESTPAP